MTPTSPNFVLLDSTRPGIANLVVAMLQARDAVKQPVVVAPARVRRRGGGADLLARPALDRSILYNLLS
jgi:hypothetical protein